MTRNDSDRDSGWIGTDEVGRPVAEWCGERLTLQQGETSRTVLTCVDRSGQCETAGHCSGTDPVVRWRLNRHDPNVTDVWTEPWRDWAGRTVAEREAAGLVT